jgi:hypothetical protein
LGSKGKKIPFCRFESYLFGKVWEYMFRIFGTVKKTFILGIIGFISSIAWQTRDNFLSEVTQKIFQAPVTMHGCLLSEPAYQPLLHIGSFYLSIVMSLAGSRISHETLRPTG